MKIIDKLRRDKQIIKAVMYARYSSDMQREESIEAQVRAIRQFAESNNIVIVGEYFDRAKTGTSAEREAFQRLLKDSAKKNFDLVLVHKVDRIGRNRYESMGFRLQLKRNDVAVISVAQLYDSESPEGIMMEAMLDGMAEYYSKNLAAEVEKGKIENALKGKHVGGIPPFGYDLDRETLKLIINEHEAKAVKMIFQMTLDGIGYDRICQELTDKGYLTKKGNLFGKNSLHDLLHNEKYTGVYVYNKSMPKDIDGKCNGHAYKKDTDIIRVDGACPAIIEKEDFAAVQKRMTKRQRAISGGKARAKEVYLLSGKVVCGECGAAYQGLRREPNQRNKKLYVSYRCSRHNRSHYCGNREIQRDPIESHVLEKLSQLVFDDKIIPSIVAGYNQFQTERNQDALQDIQGLRQNISNTNQKIDNIVNVIASTGSIALANKLKELETQKLDFESRLFFLEQEQIAAHVTAEEITEAFKEARKLFQQKTVPNLKQLVDTFVDKVTLYNDRIEISFNLGFNTDIFKEKIPHHATDKGLHDTVSDVTSQGDTCDVAFGWAGWILFCLFPSFQSFKFTHKAFVYAVFRLNINICL